MAAMTKGGAPSVERRGAAGATPRVPRATAAPPLPRPAPPRLLHTDVVAIAAAWVAITVGIWLRHGGLTALSGGWESAATSVTQVSGLLASSTGLAGLVLIARPRAIERRYGLDRLFVWHRYLMETMAILLGVHIAAGYAAWSYGRRGLHGAFNDLTGGQPYMGLATISALIVAVITIMSLRSLRRLLSYETWYFVHLSAYVAMATAFGHEVVLGGDLSSDTPARWAWGAMHIAVIGAILWGRIAPSIRAIARPLSITSVRNINAGTALVRLAGPELAGWHADAGQFVRLRPLAAGLWWQTHPFSLVSAPTTAGLEIAVKHRGDASGAITRLRRGTKVAVEGPYGIGTPDIAEGRKLVLIAGGIGITPVRALLQRVPDDAEPIVFYRAHSQHQLLFFDELRELVEHKGGRLLLLVGRTAVLAQHDPFSAHALRSSVPDIADRVAVVCGPERLVAAARGGLLAAGVASRDIHYERAWW